MKNIAVLLLLSALLPAPFARADETKPAKPPVAEPDKAEEKKEKSPWLTDYEEARKVARKEKKPIIMLFTGSDWCGYCIKLEGKILSKPEFNEWAKKNAVLFMADFPRKKKVEPAVAKQNEKLSEKFAVQGYPTVIVTDSNGKILGETGYEKMSPEAYTKHLDEIIASKGRPASKNK